ncbi:MAG: type II toxin-antitoxin system HicA family toxin [Oculatellaceae cyanobacterium Prado106]|jgi:predicted RNA binding protein YcfA (HicA-like mRNA interferase family)|nr:type II toxin-antitoxin system HicA family toxin [Oculatellaceae cyanobacterium Prado106]
MAKLPSLTGAELIAALQKIGFEVVRQKGSHIRLKHEDSRVVTIPIHSGKTIGKGLLLKILRDAELTKDDLISLLE